MVLFGPRILCLCFLWLHGTTAWFLLGQAAAIWKLGFGGFCCSGSWCHVHYMRLTMPCRRGWCNDITIFNTKYFATP
ncbi:hypothetical protein KC19_9G161900 [Ceratodon purpureus]|uniref:Secreted protein n=1 Tax=Ceratodon purpureus TaxID=3225 RepID=A0A8T0GSI6_CERPU|nr:hypothetical protein KC19_9G161900 [Ceratodon purpureus]